MDLRIPNKEHQKGDLLEEAIKLVSMLVERIKGNQDIAAHFERVRSLLEKLPLTALESPQTLNRLQTAYQYFCFREPGAANHELTSLNRYLIQRRNESASTPEDRSN